MFNSSQRCVRCRLVWLGACVQSVLGAAGRLAVFNDTRTTQDVGGRVSILHRCGDVCTECGLRQRPRQPCHHHCRLWCTQRSGIYTGHRRRQLGTRTALHVCSGYMWNRIILKEFQCFISHVTTSQIISKLFWRHWTCRKKFRVLQTAISLWNNFEIISVFCFTCQRLHVK